MLLEKIAEPTQLDFEMRNEEVVDFYDNTGDLLDMADEDFVRYVAAGGRVE